MHPTSLLVQLLEGCEDYFMRVHGRKGSNGNQGECSSTTIMGRTRHLDPQKEEERVRQIRASRGEHKIELGRIHGLVMNRDTEELTII